MDGWSDAGGAIYYYFVVSGSVDEAAPIEVAANMSTGGSGEKFESRAAVAVGTDEVNVCSINYANPSCTAYSPSFSGIIDATVASNSVNQIFIFAEANAIDGTAFAIADPQITIDPSFPDAGLFSIVLSAGIGNGTSGAIPEPASFGLLAAGLLGFGALRRRR